MDKETFEQIKAALEMTEAITLTGQYKGDFINRHNVIALLSRFVIKEQPNG
jgi:hypothetical protein